LPGFIFHAAKFQIAVIWQNVYLDRTE